MLAKLIITIKKNPDIRINYNASSLFHGVIMEKIDKEYATVMHENAIRPYSQNIYSKDEEIIWTISVLNTEAYNKIIVPFLDKSISNIYLKKKELDLKIISKETEIYSYNELLNDKYFTDSQRYIRLKFDTPTAFKSKGNYIFYPSIKNIYESIMKKYDANSDDNNIFDEEVLEHLESNTVITRYNLKSVNFHLEGVKVPAFIGEITLRINGPQLLVNLANMLFKYGEYCGVGIKSAIGMGTVHLIPQREKEEVT